MVKLPENIWLHLKGKCLDYGIIVDLKLNDGTVRKKYLVKPNGEIEGKIVGGQDGVDSTLVDFSEEQIAAVREEGQFLAKWVAC